MWLVTRVYPLEFIIKMKTLLILLLLLIPLLGIFASDTLTIPNDDEAINYCLNGDFWIKNDGSLNNVPSSKKRLNYVFSFLPDSKSPSEEENLLNYVSPDAKKKPVRVFKNELEYNNSDIFNDPTKVFTPIRRIYSDQAEFNQYFRQFIQNAGCGWMISRPDLVMVPLSFYSCQKMLEPSPANFQNIPSFSLYERDSKNKVGRFVEHLESLTAFRFIIDKYDMFRKSASYFLIPEPYSNISHLVENLENSFYFTIELTVFDLIHPLSTIHQMIWTNETSSRAILSLSVEFSHGKILLSIILRGEYMNVFNDLKGELCKMTAVSDLSSWK